MPSYKTHSIHGEVVFPKIPKQIDIELEDYKLYCIGPDSLILTDYKTSSFQHANKTREYFLYLIKTIKKKGLQNNKEVMAFLYGQLNHFVLDSVMHPLIYYMTANIEYDYKIKPHGLIETWIDDYTTRKYNKKQMLYYKKWFIKNKILKRLINDVYREVYGIKRAVLKYNIGSFSIVMFDSLARTNAIKITPLIIKQMNLGDFTYKKDLNRVLPYLNLDNYEWFNPETGEKCCSSFEDLWKKSLEVAEETIADVNRYLYQDEALTNELILNDISWNTGLSCEQGQTLKFAKKYSN